MPAAQYDFSIENSTAFEITFNYSDAALNLIDLSAYAVMFRFKGDDNSIYEYNNYTQTQDYSLKTYSNGSIVLQIPAKTTNAYQFNNAVYDLEIQEPNEQYAGSGFKLIRLLFGTITMIEKNVPTTLPNFPSRVNVNQCQDFCCDDRILDPDTITYEGMGVDLTTSVSGISSVTVDSTNAIQNIELSINNLNHEYPQDLRMFLAPPSGNKILLSGHDKILNNRPDFNFTFSNKASADTYLYNVENFGYTNIQDKTNIVKLNSESLESSFDHLVGVSPSGSWSLIVFDDDNMSQGSIESWALNIKY